MGVIAHYQQRLYKRCPDCNKLNYFKYKEFRKAYQSGHHVLRCENCQNLIIFDMDDVPEQWFKRLYTKELNK